LLAICGGEVFAPWERFSPGLVVIEQEKISYVGPWEKGRVPAGARILEAEGKLVAPGLVDVHIHGCAGADFLRDGRAGLEKMARFLARRGVTSFLPTTPSAPLEELESAIEAAREAASKPAVGARVLGLHLEGPYISPSQKGAHRPDYLRKPDIQECARLVEMGRDMVMMLTLAPELEGALNFIRWLREQGVVVSLGHSNATYRETKAAIEAGANHACHLFNCMPDLNKREPGIVGALLEDERVYTELIADLTHTHPMILQMATAMKGPRRTVLISDAMEATGMPDGSYALAGLKVLMKSGVARLEDGTLAGSTLTLGQAVKNVVEVLGIPVEEALGMASQNAADSLGPDSGRRQAPAQRGRLAVGAEGDAVIFNPDFSAAATVVGGEVVFRS